MTGSGRAESGNGFKEADLRDLFLQGRLNAHGQGERGRGTCLAGPAQAYLHDVVSVDAHHLDITAISAQAGPDLLVEDHLNPIEKSALPAVGNRRGVRNSHLLAPEVLKASTLSGRDEWPRIASGDPGPWSSYPNIVVRGGPSNQ